MDDDIECAVLASRCFWGVQMMCADKFSSGDATCI